MSAAEEGGASASAPAPAPAPPELPSPALSSGAMGAEEAAARKRYDALVQVRAKAIKGKGAWYWAHLDPVLVPPPSSGHPPKMARLRCTLCAATFSASNPSRTASEHLKRGACPNFASPPPHPPPLAIAGAASSVVPISSFPPSSQRRHSTGGGGGGRKRHALAAAYAAVDAAAAASSHQQHVVVGEPAPAAAIYSTPPTPPALPAPRQVLSGGRGDLGALARLEDSVKRLKSPAGALAASSSSPGSMLPRHHAEAALALLADWFLDCSGTVSLSSAAHPRLRAFLRHVGLPDLSPRADLARARLDARFAAARADAAARVRDARFFQLAAHGWRGPVVTLAVNLPNDTAVFHRAVPLPAPPPSDYAEEVLLDAASSVASSTGDSGDVRRCAGVVADRFGSKALRDLEGKHPWMVNLPCQARCVARLAGDLARDLPAVRSAAAACARVAAFFNATPAARALLHRHQLHELGHAALLRVVVSDETTDTAASSSSSSLLAMLEDVLASARPLQLAVLEEPFKLLCADDEDGAAAREAAETVRSAAFWAEAEAAQALLKTIGDVAKDTEAERPLVGQCLPLWEDVRGKVRGWCRKFSGDEGLAMGVVERRFRRSYHPAWAAAFILDPLYLVKDASGRYLPPFKYLTPEQEKDVDRLVTRLVPAEEAHLAMMELMKWRAEGLDPLYAQAVQIRQPDPATGKMRVANKQSSRLVWETCLSELSTLGRVAVRLIFLHATAGGFRCTPAMVRWLTARPGGGGGGGGGTAATRAQRLVFVAANARMERKEAWNDDEGDEDVELLAEGSDEDVGMLADDPTTAIVVPSSV